MARPGRAVLAITARFLRLHQALHGRRRGYTVSPGAWTGITPTIHPICSWIPVAISMAQPRRAGRRRGRTALCLSLYHLFHPAPHGLRSYSIASPEEPAMGRYPSLV